MYIAVAILAFGFLVAIHELGHFTAAKLSGVKVNEFAIGMGPKILKKQGKETLYSLRLLPFGGFCAMEGEDDPSADSRSFTAQKRWKRVVILAAGAFMNLVAGFLIVVVLHSSATGFAGTTLTDLAEGFPNEGERGLMVGDTILSINGERLYYIDDFQTFMSLSKSGTVDLVIRRGGEKITLNNFPLAPREYMMDGEPVMRYGLTFNEIPASFGEKLKYSCYTTMNYVRLIRVSFAQLFSGAAGIRDLSSPVGIVSIMNDVANDAPTFGAALSRIASLTAFIAVNLAVMNMLPIPALDGGRILFLFITLAIEKITRRKLNPKYEGYINTGAFVLLMGLMAFTLVNDVVKLIGG